MKVLLDTHIFMWWNGELNRLSPAMCSICENRENTLILSHVSIWEMQIKSQLGKVSFHQPLPQIIESQQRDNDIELLSITTEHIYSLAQLPNYHRDPFDRLLIAQSITEGIPLLTVDSIFDRYGIKLL